MQWLEKYDEHYGYDPKRAKALLAAAGYPEGFKATYILTPRPELPELMQVGEVIADYWREIGNHLFGEYATLSLFWLYTEFVANPQVVADYKTSGIFPHGTWSTSRPYSDRPSP
jgi:ABC-type transport system substrate-binding protein